MTENNEKVTLARVYELIKEQDERQEKRFNSLEQAIKQNYVERAEFAPVKNIVYGFVGLVLVSVAGALIALVVQGA